MPYFPQDWIAIWAVVAATTLLALLAAWLYGGRR